MRALLCLIGIVFLAGCKAMPPKNQDLHFIYSEIKNNHPGYYNKEDPHFRKHLVSSYINANKRISTSNQHQIINDFITSFNDNHLSIKWYEDNLIMNEISDIKLPLNEKGVITIIFLLEVPYNASAAAIAEHVLPEPRP